MKYHPLAFEVDLSPAESVVDVDSLYASLTTLDDQRDARGARYAVVPVLVFVIVAKLAGHDQLRAIGEWVAKRKDRLAEALGLTRVQAPHASTYSRILDGR